MNIHTQDTRLGKLATALGKDGLVLLRFSGDDHVNGLFEYSVDVLIVCSAGIPVHIYCG